MKKFIVALAALLMFPIAALAGPGDVVSYQAPPGNSGGITRGTEIFAIDDVGNIDARGTLDVSNGNFVVNASGNITTAGGETPERAQDISIFQLALQSVKLDALYDADGAYKSLTGIVYDAHTPALVFITDTTTPALVTLKLPEDYSSGLGFRLFVRETGSKQTGSFDGVKWAYDAPNTSPGYVDYTLYVHSDGNWAHIPVTEAGSAAEGYSQTAVRLGFDTGKLHEIDLPITLTDTTVLTATDAWVTLVFNRKSDYSINEGQWIQGAQMYYTPQY